MAEPKKNNSRWSMLLKPEDYFQPKFTERIGEIAHKQAPINGTYWEGETNRFGVKQPETFERQYPKGQEISEKELQRRRKQWWSDYLLEQEKEREAEERQQMEDHDIDPETGEYKGI